MSSSKFFLPLVVGALKLSITFVSLPLLPLTPLTPSHSPHSLLLPLTPLTPSCSPHSPLAPLAPSCPLPPQRWGAPKHSITYPYPTLAIGSKRELGEWGGKRQWEGARGSELGGTLGPTEWWASKNLPPQVVGTPKHIPWSPLCPTSAQSVVSEGNKLGARGGTLGSREVVGTPKIGTTGGRDPKTYHLMSITCYLHLVHWEWGEQVGSEGNKPWPNRGCQHPKTCPHR